MPPVISIVGRAKSGKTTLVEKLISELRGRGYRVASLKHAQEIHFEAGKDSERHLAAGAGVVGLVSGKRMVVLRPADSETDLQEIARHLGAELDVVIAEGFKRGNAPKILVNRTELGEPPASLTRIVAVAGDSTTGYAARRFDLNDTKAMADFIEQSYILPQSQRFSVYVNGKRLPLIMFPRQIMAGVILGMLKGLKGVGPIRYAEIRLGHRPENQLPMGSQD
jgi:molybdopterin-guanine dinucleotide biosynthesis protein MobB